MRALAGAARTAQRGSPRRRVQNAAAEILAELSGGAIVRLGRLAGLVRGAPRAGEGRLRAELGAHYELDLDALLNALRRAELEGLARARGLSAAGAVGDLRARLWLACARAEAGGESWLGTKIQPIPAILGGKLTRLGRAPGLEPPAPALPRPVPPPAAAPSPAEEPEDLDELLARADALVGVRLGRARRDKGAFGARAAALLGVREEGFPEPDWRGEVEIKVVPVIRDRGGAWRVAEDPAVGMEGRDPLAKLLRVLWIVRVADAAGAPVLSYFFQELGARVEALAREHLHTRPKGGAGARTRGWYLQKRFFAESGLLRSLNGGGPARGMERAGL